MAHGSHHIIQGYLSRSPEATVRIRLKDDKAFMTVKGRTHTDTRAEFEYEIPLSDAKRMLQMCTGTVIDKTRYLVDYGGHTWEVDEFHGIHEGLVIAEIELSRSTRDYPLPSFIGAEVTGDPAYYNSNL